VVCQGVHTFDMNVAIVTHVIADLRREKAAACRHSWFVGRTPGYSVILLLFSAYDAVLLYVPE